MSGEEKGFDFSGDDEALDLDETREGDRLLLECISKSFPVVGEAHDGGINVRDRTAVKSRLEVLVPEEGSEFGSLQEAQGVDVET